MNVGAATSEEIAKTPGSSKEIETFNLVLVILGTLGSVYWQDRFLTLSFLAGGALTALNFRLLRMIVGNLLGPKKVAKGKLVAQVVIKFIGGLGALAAIMLWMKPQPIAFLLGLSTIVLAVTLEGLLGLLRN